MTKKEIIAEQQLLRTQARQRARKQALQSRSPVQVAMLHASVQ